MCVGNTSVSDSVSDLILCPLLYEKFSRSTDGSYEDFLVHSHIMIMYEEDPVMK